MNKKKEIPKEILIEEYVNNRKSTTEIARILGLSQSFVHKELVRFNIPTRKRTDYGKDLSGLVFPFLTVIKKLDKKYQNESVWLCQCVCTRFVERATSSLKREKLISCGCKGLCRVGVIPSFCYNGINSHIKKNETKFQSNIDYEFCCDLFLQQSGLCALSGMELKFASGSIDHRYHKGTSASLRRIDKSVGYTKENVHWVHKEIEKMIGNLTVPSFIEFCCAVDDYILPTEKITNIQNIPNYRWNQIKLSAMHNFEITFEYAQKLFNEQNGYCNLTGIPLFFDRNTKIRNASLDRINSNFGYIEGNVQWLDKNINIMKKNYDQEHFIELCKIVSRYSKIKRNHLS